MKEHKFVPTFKFLIDHKKEDIEHDCNKFYRHAGRTFTTLEAAEAFKKSCEAEGKFCYLTRLVDYKPYEVYYDGVKANIKQYAVPHTKGWLVTIKKNRPAPAKQ